MPEKRRKNMGDSLTWDGELPSDLLTDPITVHYAGIFEDESAGTVTSVTFSFQVVGGDKGPQVATKMFNEWQTTNSSHKPQIKGGGRLEFTFGNDDHAVHTIRVDGRRKVVPQYPLWLEVSSGLRITTEKS